MERARFQVTQGNTRCKTIILRRSAKGKYIENESTKPSFKLTSVVFPESHRVASFTVLTFHPTTFLEIGINKRG